MRQISEGREFLCIPDLKPKGFGLFLELTLYGQDLQIGYCLKYSRISSIPVSMYFTKSIKNIFYFIVHDFASMAYGIIDFWMDVSILQQCSG